jgi:hypothetical protein
MADWGERRILEAQEYLDALPEDEQARAAAAVDRKGLQPFDALRLLAYLSRLPAKAREKVYELNEAGSLSINTATEVLDEPDTRLDLLRQALSLVDKALAQSHGRTKTRLEAIQSGLRTVLSDIEQKAA